jgi:hypothetical protein
MQTTILLDTNENTRKVEHEEQAHFVRSILTGFNVPIDDIWTDETLDVADMMKLRKMLSVYKIEIVDDLDGGVKIFCEQSLIAEFKKPHYVLKKDPGQVDPRKRLYLEMTTNTWSILDQEETE